MNLTDMTTINITAANNRGYYFRIGNNLVYAVYQISGIVNITLDPDSRAGIKLPVSLKNYTGYPAIVSDYYNVFHKPYDDSDGRNIITGHTYLMSGISCIQFVHTWGGNSAQFETWRDDVDGYLCVSVLYECQ